MASAARPPTGFPRLLAAAGFAGLAAGALAALWLHSGRRARRRRAKVPQGPRAPSLADELREALAREAAEAGEELDEEPQELFARATAWVGSEAGAGLSTKAKLALYGCYKQATTGDAPAARPRGMEASMKWDAWREHLGASRREAMRRYAEALDQAAPSWLAGEPASSEDAVPSRGSRGTFGPAVSTMAVMGDPSQAADVDATPVGQLCQLIADGDCEAAIAILRRQPELAFQSDKDGMTPLHWAADRGRLEVADALVRQAGKGEAAAARLSARDGGGETPLHYAMLCEHLELAQLLVGAGADLFAQNDDGATPLEIASGQGWGEEELRAK